jgi:ACR3 family arsenite efflux pump ArsB
MKLKKIFTFPAANLRFVIPVLICVALVAGLYIDTAPLKPLMLPVAMLTIFPAMIGFHPGELAKVTDVRLLVVNLVCNFFLLPLFALIVGKIFLSHAPDLRTGLLILSVIPGGNMVVAFTLLFGGNVGASLKLSVANLILGSLLAPLYLYVLAGKFVAIDIIHIGKTISLVVFVPLCLGVVTYKMLLKRFSPEQFKSSIKPLLPAASAWGMLFLVFTSISMKSTVFFSYPGLVGRSLVSLICWYLVIFSLCIPLGRLFFSRRDATTLLLNVELRNLPIAIGISVTAFSPQTTMLITLAFLFQQQFAIWFCELDKRHFWLGRD